MKTAIKKFPHQEFIEDNTISLDTLPKMLQKRIKGFEELEEDLQHTTEHDREKLFSQLDLLSYELAEDLEEHFEDQLENNDVEEELKDEPEIEHSVPLPLIEELPDASAVNEVTQIEASADKGMNDEDILRDLYTEKHRKVSPAQLIKKGFQSALDGRTITVGQYILYRGKYDTCYEISFTNK